jgi:thiol-disulfide isomerase/thioredoxin
MNWEVSMNKLRRDLVVIGLATPFVGSPGQTFAGSIAVRKLGDEGAMPVLAGATEWINSPALTVEGLRGKVVLVNFWTYSCINSLRTLPYLRAWARKYKEAGLVVVGVHSPEFAFEKISANVRVATKDLEIEYPVAVDSEHVVWRAFDNQYWPAFYFVDAKGRKRHHQFGEDRYDRSEQVLQQLLEETGRSAIPGGLVSPEGQGTQAAPGVPATLSPETYLGYARASSFAYRGAEIAADRARDYPGPPPLRLNQWSLSGSWTVGSELALSTRPGGRISFRFHARDVHLVLGAANGGRPVRFRVLIDSMPPLTDRGSDVDAQGLGTIGAPKLYQLIRQAANEKDRLFEIEFLDGGVQAYVFTFG